MIAFACLLAAGFSRGATSPQEEKGDLSTWRMATVPANGTNGLGSWIWSKQTADKQTCRLWRGFEIPPGGKVERAQIRMTADNGYRLFLDGRELGQGAEWRALTAYDITRLLPPGDHVLAVSAFNEFFQAGLILDLQIELASGQMVEIKSDETWRIVPEDEHDWLKLTHARAHWQPAILVAELGAWPWDGRWPQDFINVPQFYPIIVPFWQTGWFHVGLAMVSGIILLVCIALVIQLALQSKEQRLLHLERARIARDIHDDVGTRLTNLVLQGEVAQNEHPGDAEACARFAKISDGLREVLGAMDEVLWAVNPRRDTVRDFVTYICEYTQTFLESTPMQCLLEVEPDMPALNFELPLRRSLLLAVKEAVSNAAKHSGGTRLLLRIYRREQGLAVIVEDDGCGFNLEKISGERNGLANMVQRMNEVGGRCRIVSEPGKGCRVEFNIPLARQRSRFRWMNFRDADHFELGDAGEPGDARKNFTPAARN